MGALIRSSWLTLTLLACGGEASSPGDGPADDDAPQSPFEQDTDRDGLCDTTELEFGTDPEQLDTDGDGFPDLVELALDYDARSAADPDATQVAYLPAEFGASTEFFVRVTVHGDGEGYTGAFLSEPPLYGLHHEAEDFFDGAMAVGADPFDNVREWSTGGERFGAVFGPARLNFQLRFRYALTGEPMRCVVAHPFTYQVKTDDGEGVPSPPSLLVLGPAEDLWDAEAYCRPRDCF